MMRTQYGGDKLAITIVGEQTKFRFQFVVCEPNMFIISWYEDGGALGVDEDADQDEAVVEEDGDTVDLNKAVGLIKREDQQH